MQDDLAFFPLNSIVFALSPRDSLTQDAAVPNESSGFPGFTLAYLARREVDVDTTLDNARGLGARILKPGQKPFWGGYGGYFADPDGFLWEVAYHPFWKLDRKGIVKF